MEKDCSKLPTKARFARRLEPRANRLGVIDSYAGGRGPRELQVAVKFYF